jgi:acyl carrier protein
MTSPTEAIDEIVADVLRVDVEEFDDDSAFGTDIPAESLDYIEIAETVEFDLGIAVPDDALAEIETVGDLKAYVREHG